MEVRLRVRITSKNAGHHTSGERKVANLYHLEVVGVNTGARYARFVNGEVKLPAPFLKLSAIKRIVESNMGGTDVMGVGFDNKQRDSIGNAVPPILGPSYFAPLLPGLSRVFRTVALDDLRYLSGRDTVTITWATHADNAPVVTGERLLGQIECVDERWLS